MNKYTLITLALTAAVLTACGGGSGGGGTSGGGTSGGGTSGGGTSGGGTSGGIKPIVPLNKVSYKTNFAGKELETKAGYDGDIIVEKETQSSGNQAVNRLVIKLKNGIPSMNIVDLKKTEYGSFDCTQSVTVQGRSFKKATSTKTYDYKTGIVTVSGTGDAKGWGCTSKFKSPLETTVTDPDSIDTLLNEWGDNDDRTDSDSTGLIETNCPQSEVDDSPIDPDKDLQEVVNFYSKCDIKNITNYEITDDQGKTHKVAISGGSLSYSFLFLLAVSAFLRRKFKAV